VPRFISYAVALIALVALVSSGAFVLARFSEEDSVAIVSMYALKYSLYALAFCAAYAIAVGVYHTFLSVTGLDE
jgi:hypothetical protein